MKRNKTPTQVWLTGFSFSPVGQPLSCAHPWEERKAHDAYQSIKQKQK